MAASASSFCSLACRLLRREKHGCLKKILNLISKITVHSNLSDGLPKIFKKSQNIALSCFSRYSEQKRQFSCCEQTQTRPIVELDCTAKCTYSIPSAQQPFMTYIIAGLLRPNNCKNFKEKKLTLV